MEAVITVVGLGPGNPGHLPLAAWEVLRGKRPVYLRTENHPVVPWLKEKGVAFKGLDFFYEQGRTFEEVYRRMALFLLEEAGKSSPVFAVPGHPLVAEEAVRLLLEEAPRRGIKVEIVPAMSFVDAVCAALGLEVSPGLILLDGLSLGEGVLFPQLASIVYQVYSRLVASDVKLALLECYPPDHPVTVVRAAGVPGEERIAERPLCELDHVDWFDHLTSLYLPPCREGARTPCRYPLDPLVEVMARLRSPQGCPWDREQTHRSLRPFLLEEAYEVCEAIEQEDMYKLCEELGDLLLQVVFHCQLAREKGFFDANAVVRGITAKMLRRHPHVFGAETVRDSREVLARWEEIKAREKGKPSRLEEAPRHLPALMQAREVQARAAQVGFDWPDYRGALEKVSEELEEVRRALTGGRSADVERELGDLLFAAVNLCRLLGVEAEVALLGAVGRFRRRFRYLEEQAVRAGKDLTSFTLEQLDAWWEESKKMEEKEGKAVKIANSMGKMSKPSEGGTYE